jgi:hypothetical protein
MRSPQDIEAGSTEVALASNSEWSNCEICLTIIQEWADHLAPRDRPTVNRAFREGSHRAVLPIYYAPSMP